MTISELASMLVANTAYEDVTLMPVREQQTLAQVMTRAVSTVFSLAPDHYRRAVWSTVLLAPTSVTIAVTYGSQAVAITGQGSVDIVGKTIDLGDVAVNEVVSATELLTPVTRATGTYDATIYHNAIVLDRDIRRVVTPPILNDQGTCFRRLAFDPNPAWNFELGTPKYWRLMHPGVVLGSSLSVIMKLNPAPTVATPITVDIEHESPIYQAIDLQSASRIPLPDEVSHAILAPVAEGFLARTRLWTNQATLKSALESSQMATAAAQLLPTQTAPVVGFIRTRPLY